MLSGIKVGKKKRFRVEEASETSGASTAHSRPAALNLDAAAALRAQLSSTSREIPASSAPSQLPYESLQYQGRISIQKLEKTSAQDTVVLTGAAAANKIRPDYSTEDYRTGARKGKVKRKAVDTIGTTEEEADMTIQDMLQAEKTQTESMDEVYVRNVARLGSRFQGRELKGGSSAGADEEDYIDMKVYQKQSLTKVAAARRDTSRQLAQHDLQTSIAQKCWWWMESPSFRKHMLLALGNHVSLVMAPAHVSLFPGDQFYLVPLQQAESFVGCDDNVWNEIYRFQRALRSMYSKEGKDVLFMETVIGGKGFWQTRLVGIPVARKQNDAPMYFKQAMMEQAEEWGTHNKILSTKNKGLRRTIPKSNFSYFYVEWDQDDGFAQIIESETTKFPKDFGADTVAGMLEMDPIRFRRTQRQSHQEEVEMVLEFLKKWKPVDWTVELEG